MDQNIKGITLITINKDLENLHGIIYHIIKDNLKIIK